MRLKFTVLLLIISCIQLAAQPIGSWQEQLPFANATWLGTGTNTIITSTPYAFFTLNTNDNSIRRFSKVNGLTETGVQFAAIAPGGDWVIAYRNSGIDMLNGDQVIEVDALKDASINADKTLFDILFTGDQGLLATGLGIVQLNLQKKEIGDTWVIGNEGKYNAVYGTAVTASHIYAASAEGLKRAPLTGVNLADYRNWQNLSGSNGIPSGKVDKVFAIGQQVIIQKGNALYSSTGQDFTLLYSDAAIWEPAKLVNGNITICQKLNAGPRILALSATGNILRSQANGIQQPKQAILLGENLWVADSLLGLLRFGSDRTESFVPNSPAGIGGGSLYMDNGEWWVSAGSVSPEWQNQNRPGSLFRFVEGNWQNFTPENTTALNGTKDIISLISDQSRTIWAGSFGSGLLQWRDGQFRLFREGSFIGEDASSPGQYRVSGLAVDGLNNLWISNYGAAQNLVVLFPDGNSRRFAVPFPLRSRGIGQLIIDDLDQKWIIGTNGFGLICYNHGTSIDNAGDDRWKQYLTGQGNGNLPSNEVLCISKDKFGFIWIGTADGIGIIQCPQEVFGGNGCEAVLPVVQTDNFAGYLFKGERVQAIAVDGANRKWIGTRNGAWLISADGEKTIHRFTSENSPLPDNNVLQISIDQKDGTVLFVTASGMYSYKGDATAGSNSGNQVLVYPNPVPPGFNGTIAIKGLVENAIVKITELNGRLVYQTRALGGQAIWNGKDYNGRTISTGVYLVLVSDTGGNNQTVGKIVFIGR
ncbi:T9SS type A sorting domain-containing protein [Flavihumibacter rivuli]|uniref:type IX secretion system anionic LPS delivery protein PorZ n=1 Tax=Flavihumibacter rivuli TaxID=2838156 RepID=UPI001BDE73CC|nr:T9SS type A sorting domain-containing protein [Flavihumibacter rivuli]ULQ55109.1 T9SS type A sorting domain-containing protein [Flavihumibacter rivuli]